MRCEVTDLLAGAGRPEPAPSPRVEHTTVDVVIAATCMLIAAVLWGSSFFFIHIALRGFDAETITATRCLIGACVVGTVALLQRSNVRRGQSRASLSSRPVAISVAAAGFFTAMALLGVAVGQGTVSSSVTGIVLGTVPVWTTAIVAARSALRGHASNVSPSLLVALALGTMAGVLPAIGAETAATTIGLVILLAASISHAGSMVAAPPGIARLGPTRNTSALMFVATIVLLPSLLFGDRHFAPDAASVLALLEIGILPTGLAYIAFFRAVAVLGAPRATIAIYLIPLVALLIGTVIGGETLTAGALAGGACALAAVAITVMPRRSTPSRAQPVTVPQP